MKKKIPIITISVVIIFVFIGLIDFWTGDIVETWQVENQNLKLRIEMREEICFAVCGAYYTFQSAPVGSDRWREIFTARHDDPNPIPRENLRFVNPQISYVFFRNQYAVTTDAGKTWTLWDAWDANRNMQFEKYKLYPSIEEVNIESDGRGRLRLYSISNKPMNQPELQTADYGESWHLN